MLCQKCLRNQATAHFTQIVNGQKKEMYLCPECAAKMDMSFPDIFSNMFFGDLIFDDAICPECGTTFSQIKSIGTVGCPKCYDVFSETLLPYIKKIQGTDRHMPAARKVSPPKKELLTEKEKLENKLKQAIEKEEYEQAAIIRDEIRKISGGEG